MTKILDIELSYIDLLLGAKLGSIHCETIQIFFSLNSRELGIMKAHIPSLN